MVDDALRWFVDFMDSGDSSQLSAYLLGACALVTLLVLVHELGHAAVALACTESLVLLRVGRYPGLVRGRIGRLQFSLDPRRSHGEALAVVYADLTPGERLAYALAGPTANLAVALLLVPTYVATSGGWRWATGLAIGLSALVAAHNLLSRDPESDGQRALAAFRNRRGHTPNDFGDVVGTWMALFARSRDARFSGRRAALFGAALPELGVDAPSSNGEHHEYWHAARAGWCWREVSPAPEALVEGATRAAWKQQSLEGHTGLELAAAAASAVVRSGGPGDVEDGFLVTAELYGVPADDERIRFAFRYGAALHDVERVLAAAGQRYW